MEASALMKLGPKELPPSGESRRITLEALRTLLDARRNDPDPKVASAIREFERIQQEIERIENILPEDDPIAVAVRLLEDNGDWMPVKQLAEMLDQKGMKAPGTRKKAQSALERRAWTNAERLGRSLLLSVSHGTLTGYVAADGTKFIGLPGFKYPANVKKIKATRKSQGGD